MSYQVLYGRCLIRDCICSSLVPSEDNNHVCDCKHPKIHHMVLGHLLPNNEFIADPGARSGEKASTTTAPKVATVVIGPELSRKPTTNGCFESC